MNEAIDVLSPESTREMQARRRRRLRIGTVSVAGGLIALVVVHLCWDFAAGRRLESELARLRAAGEPILPADFNPAQTPGNEENAALFYMAAAQTLSAPPSLGGSAKAVLQDWRAADLYPEESRRVIEAHERPLQLLRRGRFREAADWRVRMRTPALYTELPHLAGQRSLGRFAACAAYVQHKSGDDAAAVETLRDVLALARHLQAPPTFIISHLVAVHVEGGMAAEAIERIAPRLEVIDGEGPVPQAGPAWRRQVRELIGDLLDESAAARAIEDAMRTERMMQLDAAREIVERRLSYHAITTRSFDPNAKDPIPLWAAVIGGPAMEADIRRMLLHMEQCREAVRGKNWPAVDAAMPAADTFWAGNMLNLLTHPLSRFLVPSLDRAVALHFRALAMRRMAAVRLATRLYEIDHDGERPAVLGELAPVYLDALPADPFRGDGGTFGYLPEGAPAILYSIGRDGDDGGRIAYKGGLVNPDYLDIPFFLDGDRPHAPMPTTAPASREAANKDHHVEQNVGHDQGEEHGEDEE